MKTLIITIQDGNKSSLLSYLMLLFAILILGSCSSDDSGEDMADLDPSFEFILSSGEDPTVKGNTIVFTETITEVEDFQGNDVNLTTLLVVATDEDSTQEITFAITEEGRGIGSGDYPIGTDLFEFYNAFLNYAEDPNVELYDYQALSGSINISSKGGGFITGSVSVNCGLPNEDESVLTITGTFTAPSAN